MKPLAIAVIAITLTMAIQPNAAQKITRMPQNYLGTGMPIFEMMFQTMENFGSANGTIESNCRLPSYEKNTNKYFYILKKKNREVK